MTNIYMPDGKNIYSVAKEMTSFIEIFTSQKKHEFKCGDIIVQRIDNKNKINVFYIQLDGTQYPNRKLPLNYLVIRFSKVSENKLINDTTLEESALEVSSKLRLWLYKYFHVYYQGTCQQSINSRNLRLVLSDMMQDDMLK